MLPYPAPTLHQESGRFGGASAPASCSPLCPRTQKLLGGRRLHPAGSELIPTWSRSAFSGCSVYPGLRQPGSQTCEQKGFPVTLMRLGSRAAAHIEPPTSCVPAVPGPWAPTQVSGRLQIVHYLVQCRSAATSHYGLEKRCLVGGTLVYLSSALLFCSGAGTWGGGGGGKGPTAFPHWSFGCSPLCCQRGTSRSFPRTFPGHRSRLQPRSPHQP